MSKDPQISEWGNPARVMTRRSYMNQIVYEREPGEPKHPSTRRKRKKIIDVQSSGERNGQSPNQV